MPAPTLSLKGRVLRLLTQREHSKAELARKLRALETDDGALARVLDDFEAKGLISEQRVANSVVNTKGKKLGGLRIKFELQAKGLSDDLVRETVSHLKDTEMARAQSVWAKKFGEAPADTKGQAKQMRFLAARGFDGGVVRAVVPRVASGAGDGWPSSHGNDQDQHGYLDADNDADNEHSQGFFDGSDD
jgi:regulatory protein